MAIPTVAGAIFQGRIHGLLHNQQTVTVFHYRNPAAKTDGIASQDELLATFETLVWNNIRGQFSQEWNSVALEGQYVFPTRIVKSIRIPTNRTGALAFDANPSGVSVVVRRRTEKAGRRYRGRIFIPGITINDTNDSFVTAAFVAAANAPLQNAIIAQLTQAVGGNVIPVVWSPKFPLDPTDVKTGQLDTVIRYQRRREVGVGQ